MARLVTDNFLAVARKFPLPRLAASRARSAFAPPFDLAISTSDKRKHPHLCGHFLLLWRWRDRTRVQERNRSESTKRSMFFPPKADLGAWTIKQTKHPRTDSRNVSSMSREGNMLQSEVYDTATSFSDETSATSLRPKRKRRQSRSFQNMEKPMTLLWQLDCLHLVFRADLRVTRALLCTDQFDFLVKTDIPSMGSWGRSIQKMLRESPQEDLHGLSSWPAI